MDPQARLATWEIIRETKAKWSNHPFDHTFDGRS